MPAGLKDALKLFVLVRLPWLLLTVRSRAILPQEPRGIPAPLDGPSWANAWLRWDSGWYLRIINEGFFASNCLEPGPQCQQATISFLPAYPMSVKGLMQLGLSLSFSSFLFNSLCLVAALWGLIELGRQLFGPQGGERAAWGLLLFPTTLFFSAGYAEALFTASSIWAFIAWQRGWAPSFALLISLAALSRPHGIVFAGLLLLGALIRKRFKLAFIGGAVLALIFGAYLVWQQQRFGDPLAFFHARRAWNWTPTPVPTRIGDYWRHMRGPDLLSGWLDFCSLPLLLITAWFSARRLSLELAVFCLIMLAVPLSQGQVWGMSRAVLGAFPVFLLCASVPYRLRPAAAALGATLATVSAVIFVNGGWVA